MGRFNGIYEPRDNTLRAMNFDNYKFRSHAIGKLMTNPRKKSDILSQTTKTYLDEIYVQEKYGRKKIISTKYMDKGNLNEEESITMASNYKEASPPLLKNEKNFMNDFICGTPDIVCDTVIDVKSNWDLWTFFKAELSKDYDWQLRGYLWLTGLTVGELVYCLTNTPEHLVRDEQQRMFWKHKIGDDASDEEQERYQHMMEALYKRIEKNMTFDDIPENERLKVFTVEHEPEKIDALKNRVVECRAYLNSL